MDQFVEMLRAAQGGRGFENLARVYGLSAQQAQAAAEAVMPAFADGFRHATQSPEALASLMALMLSGPYGSYYNQPTAAPELNSAGTDALNAVFGSTDVSRAVANHVAASTGLGIAIVRQMMPTFASLVVGGLAKSLAASGAMQQMTAAMLSRMPIGQPETRTAPISSGNPWVDAFMTFAAASQVQRPYGSAGTGNPWADAFAQMMFQRAAPAPAPQRPTSGNAWQDVVNAMASTMSQAAAPPRPPEPEPQSNPLQPFQEFFAKLFAQGFPPSFPGSSGTDRPAYSFPEFWLDVMSRANRQATPEAEVLPPEKPRLIKGQGGKGEGG